MLKLNLIAPALKKELKYKHLIYVIKKACNSFIIIAIIVSLYLSAGWYLLYNQYSDTVKQSGLNIESSESYDDKVSAINSQLDTISEIQKDYYRLSLIFNELMSSIAGGVKLSSIKINRLGERIELQGQANNRDNLLEFKNNLGDSKMFDNIELPISNILQKTDLAFEISASLNLYENR